MTPIERMCAAIEGVTVTPQQMRKAILALSETVPTVMVDTLDNELKYRLNLYRFEDDDERFSFLLSALVATIKAVAAET